MHGVGGAPGFVAQVCTRPCVWLQGWWVYSDKACQAHHECSEAPTAGGGCHGQAWWHAVPQCHPASPLRQGLPEPFADDWIVVLALLYFPLTLARTEP